MIKYFPHLDGLRAIAVLLVLCSHLEIINGGFVGVDIFFVISGFLITKIILKELNNTGSFSFLNFYTRRAKRLLPSLFAVIILSLIIGFLVLSQMIIFPLLDLLLLPYFLYLIFIFYLKLGTGMQRQLLSHCFILGL